MTNRLIIEMFRSCIRPLPLPLPRSTETSRSRQMWEKWRKEKKRKRKRKRKKVIEISKRFSSCRVSDIKFSRTTECHRLLKKERTKIRCWSKWKIFFESNRTIKSTFQGCNSNHEWLELDENVVHRKCT